MGELDLWQEAESQLQLALNESGLQWTLNEKDGAFYGPKIDIKLTDGLGRQHQCATIQLDFQLPINFDLKYMDGDDTSKRPVMIHRAIYGSFERFFAILSEHYQGKWPLWLSPKQVLIIPIKEDHVLYAQSVQSIFRKEKIVAHVDGTDKTLAKRIRDAQTESYNYIVVVGGNERTTNTCAVRQRDNQQVRKMTPEELKDEVLEKIKQNL
jgi:threonyl-tRNA synthetase